MRVSRKSGFTVLGVLFGFSALFGCRGPAGATGPMGPSGPGTGSPVYFLNQDFDGTGYNPSSQFSVYAANGGNIIMGLTGSNFVSAPTSLSVTSSTGGVGIASGLYTSPGAFPYLGGYDYYLDTYVNFETSSGAKTEVMLILNGNAVADFGYLAPTTVYTYENGASVTLSSGLGAGYFHHVILYWSHATGLSSLTLDGNLIVQNVSGIRAEPTGAPTTGAGLYFPNSTSSGNYVLLDNFSVYHY
jgi:hypothetical protein